MRNNESLWAFLIGIGAGAALMYFLDPDRGRTRRAYLRDQAVGLSNDVREAINNTTEDLSNRAYGVMAETSKAITGKPFDETGDTQANAATNRA